MSRSDLSIATVTATLRCIIFDAVHPLGAHVTNNPPGTEPPGPPDPRVNIFMHQALPNAQYRNDHLPTRNAAGRLVDRPEHPVNLRYLVTFYGDSASLMPQVLMARTLVALHSKAVFTHDLLEAAVAAETARDLRDSALLKQVVMVTVRPAPLNYDDLYRLWSVFTHTPYSLSSHYEAGPVLLQEDEARPIVPVPIAARQVVLALAPPIRIEALAFPVPTEGPLPASGSLRIRGGGFADGMTVSFTAGTRRFDVTPAVDEIAPDAIMIPAAKLAELRCGVTAVQVVRRSSGVPRLPLAQSNAVMLMVRPVMTALRQEGLALVALTDRPVDVSQLVTLELRRQGADTSYSLAPETTGWQPPRLVFAAGGIFPGDYLAFLTIDGVSSGLESPVHEVRITPTARGTPR